MWWVLLSLFPGMFPVEWPVLPWMHSDVMWFQEPLRHLAEIVLPLGNHSCIPNAETSFPENNFLLHLTALEDIEAGEVSQQGLGAPEVTSHHGIIPVSPTSSMNPSPKTSCVLHHGRGIQSPSHVGAARPPGSA